MSDCTICWIYHAVETLKAAIISQSSAYWLVPTINKIDAYILGASFE
jgi:hypothetical protein